MDGGRYGWGGGHGKVMSRERGGQGRGGHEIEWGGGEREEQKRGRTEEGDGR